MTVKSINIIVNNFCNNKCTSCDIWTNTVHESLSMDGLASLLKRHPDAEDISLTGGEPFLRKDLPDVMNTVIQLSPKLEKLFINTNGVMPRRVEEYMQGISGPELYLCVSLEGDREMHNKLRGGRYFDLVMQTLRLEGNYTKIISTTLQEDNCTMENFRFIEKVALETGSQFTFRFAEVGPYYQNTASGVKAPSKENMFMALDMMEKYGSNPFFEVQKKFIMTGDIPLMMESGVNKCRAGDIFFTVHPNGSIRPCIYSERVIGNVTSEIIVPTDLGKYEKCPCCTECTVYPMLNYGKE